jgi:hypothetical protein
VRPLNFTVRTHMKLSATPWRHRHALVAFCAAASLVSEAGCTDDCTHSVGPALRSPNGQWTAQTKETICGGKVLALGSDSTVVELSRHKSNYSEVSGVVLSAEGLRDDDIHVRWVSNYQLDLTVPSHTNINTLAASYYGIDVSLNFVPPDPAGRARWVSYRRAFDAWTDQVIEWDRRRAADPATAGPRPKQPQWQAADTGPHK